MWTRRWLVYEATQVTDLKGLKYRTSDCRWTFTGMGSGQLAARARSCREGRALDAAEFTT